MRGQLDAVLSDVTPDAVKVGMLPDSDSVNIVAEAIEHYGLTHVVVDPVIVSTSGRPSVFIRSVGGYEGTAVSVSRNYHA